MSNLPQDLVQMGTKRNIMREIREYGLLRAREVGAENVLDFSLGNPSVAPPAQVNDTIRAILDSPEGASIHGYTTAQGDWSLSGRPWRTPCPAASAGATGPATCT